MTDGIEHEDPATDEADPAEVAADDVTEAQIPAAPISEQTEDELTEELPVEDELVVADGEPPGPEEAEAAEEPLVEVAEAEPVLAEAAEEPAAEGETETAEEPGAEGDDVSAAIAAAGENIGVEPSLDDITPGTVVSEEPAAVAVAEPAGKPNSVSIWPFVAYDVLWAGFAGALVWLMKDLPEGTAIWQSINYPYFVLGGVVLTAAGVLMILAVWIASWGKPGSTKGGLFVSALVKGSVGTLLGVIMWWAALLALDQIRFGGLM